MAFKIEWTEEALADYQQVIEYLFANWSTKVAEHFIAITESRLKTLSVHPYQGMSSIKSFGVRSIVLIKHNKLYYRVSGEYIEILNIFDTRQHPEKNQY